MPTQSPIQIEHRGMTIRGTTYLPDLHGRRPTVLFLHSFAGHRIEGGFAFVRVARHLASRGIAAVTFDFLHSGESDGSFEQMLASGELADAQRMAEWVAGQPFVDRTRVGLLGFSLGGLLAACLNARVNMFRSLALIAPTTPQNLVGNVLKRADATGKITIGAHTLNPQFTDDVLKFDPLADVIKHPRPTLLVQGTGDTAVAPAVSQRYADAMNKAGVPVTHQLVADADHNFGNPLWQKQLIGHVGDFFAKTLG
jgi:dienelactone hydrolase